MFQHNIIDSISTKPIINNSANLDCIDNCASLVLKDNDITFYEDYSDYTVDQIYTDWSKEVFPTKEEIEMEKEYKQRARGKLSESHMTNLRSVYNIHFTPIKNKRYRNVTADDFQSIIDNCKKSDSVLSAIINLMRKFDKFAARKNIITMKQSDNVTVEYQKNRTSKIPFSNEQIHKIWSKEGLLWADIVLYLLYSGTRIEECFDLRTIDVYLDDDCIFGGIKTQAGINRALPIHSAIKHIVERYYNPNNKYLFMFEGKKIKKATFYKYYYLLLDELHIPHIVPHTTRTTFRTELDNKCTTLSQKTCIDKIMGHITNDVGKDVYAKKDLIPLLETINCITYDINDKQHYISPSKLHKVSNSKTVDNYNSNAMADFNKNIKLIKTYQRFLKKINRNYAKAKNFDELLLVETIAQYNIDLNELQFNPDYFFKCRDAIDNLYGYYYKNFVLKT